MKKYTTDTLFNSQTREDVLKCIKAGIDINEINEYGMNALFFCRHMNAVKAMIEAGIEVNHTDYDGNNALFSNHNPQVLELLIHSGVNIQHKNNKGQCCLHWQRYDIDCAELLINAGVDIHSTDNEGQTLLYNLHDHNIFDYWVNKGSDINHRDYNGKAVLELPTDDEWWIYDFSINALQRHVDRIDSTPVLFKHISSAALPLIALLHEKGRNILIAEHCTFALYVKNMKSFFTSLKKHTDISHVQFYNCYHDRHIGAYTGIETVKWLIRNGIRVDDDILRQRADSDKVFDYITGREKKNFLKIMKPEIIHAPKRKRM
ncbi:MULTISPECIES: ankyrin repeat domain-containing protein [Enterobacteriaceae]|uniref:ankyrin repeat domain-containing protein n=1 Tax=Enterobacteriaceae TaxID=543 RepID=UPI00227C434F|nr:MULTISPECIES: ankyrin repeat domain-containing protein [Enterobacteriaceae]MCY3525770.1 ankyrin repeat domain-containing protein [Klebsiella variicola]MDW3573718.1 ankyrin repeat domain-containing protein [Enterobacter asburiae]HCB1141347.1 ankyrin repeat domain-containing protein [Klebsiella variicola subsp. variicola]